MRIPRCAHAWTAKAAFGLVASVLACACPAHDGAHPARAERVAPVIAGAGGSVGERTTASAVAVTRQSAVRIPDVGVIDVRGKPRRLAPSLASDEAVLLNFVFTTCSTICSTQTAVLAEFQRRLVAAGKRARFVSITIDPDNDTPERLAVFARQFEIERDWSFFTGEFDDLIRVQQAFDVYRGAKSAHPPVVLLKRAHESTWVRIEGMPAPSDLLAVFDQRGPGR